MPDFSAESAYVFRHALLREAAYELHLPTDRAQLHALALHALEQALADAPGALSATAHELADHAAQGQSFDPALAPREVHYLVLAAGTARQQFRHEAEAVFLARIVNHSAASGPSRLRALENLGNNRARSGRGLQALEHFQALLKHAREANDSNAELAALTGTGQALRNMNRLAEATPVLLQAIERANETSNTEKLAVAAGMLGVLREAEGMMSEAAVLYERSLAAARACGDIRSEELALGNHANLHMLERRYDEAMQLYTQALAIAQRRGDLRTQGVWTGNMALVHGRQGREELAEQMIHQCLQLARRCGDLRTEGTMLANYATHLVEVGRRADANGPLRRALEIARELQQPVLETLVLVNLGRLQLEDGLPQAAEATLRDAMQVSRRAKLSRDTGAALGYLGGARKAQGHFSDARDMLTEAVKLARTSGDNLNHAGWLVELAVLERQCGNEEAALAWWQTAEAALAKLGDPAVSNRLAARFAAAAPGKP